ncbi:phosphatase PAP2 family protein [bacterium]|nr:phosphatase PAP2 family protein [bacterium]
MQAWDAQLFALMTAGPEAPGWLVLVASFAATWIVPLVAGGLVLAWIFGRGRSALLDAVASGFLGLGAVQAIGLILYRPRPFEVGQGLNLMHHLPENSFPSDHATLMFALATSLILSRKPVGRALLLLAIAVGWARVYLGAHWPGDILGGAVLGAACAAIVHRLAFRLPVWAGLDGLYHRVTGH